MMQLCTCTCRSVSLAEEDRILKVVQMSNDLGSCHVHVYVYVSISAVPCLCLCLYLDFFGLNHVNVNDSIIGSLVIICVY